MKGTKMESIRAVITCEQTNVFIDNSNPIIAEHFDNPVNYADVVLNYMNGNRMYDPYLSGLKNLAVLDLGANIGLFTLYALPCSKKIVAVEPSAHHYKVLVEMTKKYPNVVAVQAAVNSIDGLVNFTTHEFNTTMNSIVNNYGFANAESVVAKSIQTLMKENDLTEIDFVKCDIEGGEMSLFTEDMLSDTKGKIKCWVIEVHPTTFTQQQNLTTITNMFIKGGYKVVQINHETICCTI